MIAYFIRITNLKGETYLWDNKMYASLKGAKRALNSGYLGLEIKHNNTGWYQHVSIVSITFDPLTLPIVEVE